MLKKDPKLKLEFDKEDDKKVWLPMKAKKADIRVPLIEFMNRVDNCDITDMDKRVNLLLRNLTEAGLTIVVCPTRS